MNQGLFSRVGALPAGRASSLYKPGDWEMLHQICILFPVVPHRAVAEVSKIGNL